MFDPEGMPMHWKQPEVDSRGLPVYVSLRGSNAVETLWSQTENMMPSSLYTLDRATLIMLPSTHIYNTDRHVAAGTETFYGHYRQ